VYGIEEEAVTKEMRRKAKSVNFGIIYGQGAFGLAENLGISRTEAKTIIDNYKKEFAGITQYMDDMINYLPRAWICANGNGTQAMAERYQLFEFYGEGLRRTERDQFPHSGNGGGYDQAGDGKCAPCHERK
jgi:hypothetical protein